MQEIFCCAIEKKGTKKGVVIVRPQISLLEYFLMQARPMLLSDLQILTAVERSRLLQALETLPAESFPLWEWNDAIAYLVHGTPAPTPQAAKEQLISAWSLSIRLP